VHKTGYHIIQNVDLSELIKDKQIYDTKINIMTTYNLATVHNYLYNTIDSMSVCDTI